MCVSQYLRTAADDDIGEMLHGSNGSKTDPRGPTGPTGPTGSTGRPRLLSPHAPYFVLRTSYFVLCTSSFPCHHPRRWSAISHGSVQRGTTCSWSAAVFMVCSRRTTRPAADFPC